MSSDIDSKIAAAKAALEAEKQREVQRKLALKAELKERSDSYLRKVTEDRPHQQEAIKQFFTKLESSGLIDAARKHKYAIKISNDGTAIEMRPTGIYRMGTYGLIVFARNNNGQTSFTGQIQEFKILGGGRQWQTKYWANNSGSFDIDENDAIATIEKHFVDFAATRPEAGPLSLETNHSGKIWSAIFLLAAAGVYGVSNLVDSNPQNPAPEPTHLGPR